MAVHTVRLPDKFEHIHNVLGHMSKKHIMWHRENSLHANFTDAQANQLYVKYVYTDSRDK